MKYQQHVTRLGISTCAELSFPITLIVSGAAVAHWLVRLSTCQVVMCSYSLKYEDFL